MFTIGDATVHPGIGSAHIKAIFDDTENTKTNTELLKAVSKKYEVFHIVTKNAGSVSPWNELLPGRVAYIEGEQIQYLSEVITSIMQITNGMSKEDAVNQWPKEARSVVATAIENIKLTSTSATAAREPKPEKKSFFSKLFRK